MSDFFGLLDPLVQKLHFHIFKIKFTFKMLDASPVLCPTPEEPTLSRSCLPQSEKDRNKKWVKFSSYYALNNELKILPGWFDITSLNWITIASKYRNIFSWIKSRKILINVCVECFMLRNYVSSQWIGGPIAT